MGRQKGSRNKYRRTNDVCGHLDRPHHGNGRCSNCCDHIRNHNPHRKWYRIKLFYGLSKEDFTELLNKQGGGCYFCGKTSARLCVDHCHKTGKIRGILCYNCNSSFGHYERFMADPKTAQYLSNETGLVVNANVKHINYMNKKKIA